MIRRPPSSPLFPSPTLFRSNAQPTAVSPMATARITSERRIFMFPPDRRGGPQSLAVLAAVFAVCRGPCGGGPREKKRERKPPHSPPHTKTHSPPLLLNKKQM